MEKRGISPLIATVLLIGFAIVLAALVFRWGGQFFNSQTEQTDEEVKQVLALVGVDLRLNGAEVDGCGGDLKISLANLGHIDIVRFIFRITEDDNITLLESTDGLPGYNTGWIAVNYTGTPVNIDKIEVFPVIIVNGKETRDSDPAALKVFGAGDIVASGCPENCINGVDDDGDLLIDCDDDDCISGADANTVLLFDFNQGGGTVVCDQSGNGNHGILGNGVCLPGVFPCPNWVSNASSYSLDFLNDEPDPGTYVEVVHQGGGFPSEFSEMTIEASLTLVDGAWFENMGVLDKRDIINNQGFYLRAGHCYQGVYNYDCWRLEIGNGSEFRYYQCLLGYMGTYFIINSNTSYDLAVTYDSNLALDNLKFYESGTQLICTGPSGSPDTFVGFGAIKMPSSSLIVGKTNYSVDDDWDGLMDNITISDVVRTF
ncbi:MAG: hypothetical protein KKH88_00430 [Nanoarchaeota archaeon]|nr:hypothetical protein [Nanoarchaeota archaeon]